MDTLERLKRYDNLHIVFWLIKDSCWMLELKWLGALVMIPTLYLAVHIVVKTFGSKEFYINMAILFWITANSFWMMMEFFNHDHYKQLAIVPFSLGLLFVAVYYAKYGFQRTNEKA